MACECISNDWIYNGNNSFMTYLKLEVPDLLTLNYICHSSAFIASKACANLFFSCENLIRGVATYFFGQCKEVCNFD